MENRYEQIAKDIHNKAKDEVKQGNINRMFMEHYLINLEKLSYQDKKKLVEYNFNHFSGLYSIEFMLSTPELWKNFKYENWQDVMRNLNQSGLLVLLEFIYKYLEINSFKIYAEMENDSTSKRKVLEWFSGLPSAFVKDIDDYDDFEDGLFAEIDSIYAIKNQMLKDERIEEANQDLSDLTYLV